MKSLKELRKIAEKAAVKRAAVARDKSERARLSNPKIQDMELRIATLAKDHASLTSKINMIKLIKPIQLTTMRISVNSYPKKGAASAFGDYTAAIIQVGLASSEAFLEEHIDEVTIITGINRTLASTLKEALGSTRSINTDTFQVYDEVPGNYTMTNLVLNMICATLGIGEPISFTEEKYNKWFKDQDTKVDVTLEKLKETEKLEEEEESLFNL